MHILGEMGKALGTARTELGEHAPRIETIKIPTDKIREVIGSGGSVIREIVAESGAKIDIDDDGTVKVAAAKRESIEEALRRIREITSEPEVGTIYSGKVVKIMEFGAFVNFFGAKDGLVHISQLAPGRPETVGEVVKEGQEVYVKLLGFDERGKTRLSMKIIDQATGQEIPRAEGEAEPEAEFSAARPPRRDREGGGRGRRARGATARRAEASAKLTAKTKPPVAPAAFCCTWLARRPNAEAEAASKRRCSPNARAHAAGSC